MKLTKLILKNFRSYRNIELKIDDLTTLIGKNDIGKSTILEALDIFFNGKNAKEKIDQDDLNVFAKKAGETNIDIICTFKDLPTQIIVDSTSVTTLQDEKLCEDLDTLTLRKSFDASKKTMSEKDSILSRLSSEEANKPLLTLKHKKLMTLYKSINVPGMEIDERSNVELRKAIRSSYSTKEDQKVWVTLSGEDGPEIFKKIESSLPIYQLFQSDRSNNDDDEDVTDPVNLAIKQALSDKKDEINDVLHYVNSNVQNTMNSTLNKLRELDPKIASGLRSDFTKEPNLERGFNAKILSDNGIPINKRGSGVRRLILLSFFRAEAESKNTKENIIYAFEEPETSQHLDNQKKIMESFLNLVDQGKQVIITTHTAQIGKMVPISSIRLIEESNGKRIIKDNFAEKSFLHEVKKELGISVNDKAIQSSRILLLEGPGDVIFLRNICQWMIDNKLISDTLEDKGWILLPTGGCSTLATWVELDIYSELGKNWYIFMDSDKGTDNEKRTQKHIKELVKAYPGAARRIHITRKREIENYLVDNIDEPKCSFKDDDDVKKIMRKKDGIRGRKVVSKLMSHMSFEDFQGQDEYIGEDGKKHYEIEDFIEKLLK